MTAKGPISGGSRGGLEDGSKVPILVDLEGADLGDRIYGSRVDRICRGAYVLGGSHWDMFPAMAETVDGDDGAGRERFMHVPARVIRL